ncbi:YqiA/YcfP family alpha/beta fold hydrolase [Prevotella sp. MA2016]|uniref:YqiA/YcfP family alpha/beta fold hydrolase n=1 Tax=Prevotella sp. MA2016 TaxID=1408310 RepID=UPI00056A7944|nr:YqiA/YcfP family alpha/beta fold hydrolase [Prevotella sp. MA2016]
MMDLFKGKKVMYVHGFGSSGQSGTVTRIREVLTEAEVIAPDLPIHPEEAMDLLYKMCETEKPDLIIGTSMGGMYAEMLHGFDRILVNPAMQMGDTMKEHGMIGAQHFQNPRQDGVQDFIVTKALVKEYKDITEKCFADTSEAEQQHVWGLFGDEDTTVNTYDLFRQHYQQAVRFHGEHRMNDGSFMHSVVPVIRWVSDKQEGRERPIVYISTSSLIDAYGKPRSSSQKAIRQLLETYQLYFVAPATVDAKDYADVNAWLYEYVNVPAYGHTIFTNQKHLLYGDYLIDTHKVDGMATLIEFGSDTFKTWDDIIPYFERLGGQ